jgi:hypothetical protein
LQLCAWSIVLPLPSPKALPPEALAVAEDEVFKNPRELIYKFKSSLKTSAIAPHAVVVGVREAPCTVSVVSSVMACAAWTKLIPKKQYT